MRPQRRRSASTPAPSCVGRSSAASVSWKPGSTPLRPRPPPRSHSHLETPPCHTCSYARRWTVTFWTFIRSRCHLVRMTTKEQLNARVHTIIATITSGLRVEDQTVECKREWIQIPKMARQLAGLANAANGEEVLWIVGIDDDKRVILGAQAQELANYIPQLHAEYDANCGPELLIHSTIHYDHKTVHALLFDSCSAPYVIKARRNDVGGTNPEYEVPFRVGESTITARRQHLLRIFAPASRLPAIEFLHVQASGSDRSRMGLMARMHITTPGGQRVVIPDHRCGIGFRVDADEKYVPASGVSVRREEGNLVIASSKQLVVDGGAFARISGVVEGDCSDLRDHTLIVRVEIGVANADRPLTFEHSLEPMPNHPMVWMWRADQRS